MDQRLSVAGTLGGDRSCCRSCRHYDVASETIAALYDFTPTLTDADITNLEADQTFKIDNGMLPNDRAIVFSAT
ncbi:hypothetical protein [Pleomorphomonas sp. NRK KF1]|uniref:hypothetical protein n=1 Tax=Pleomorphomonas sp. NRK KF1 TaxID=2943000 RepID=UPI002044B7A2|nr:hypothetical protein [Pleomorphomonas sp. NRK KF1]MCM5552208.1 hypothetical protein [Pleomorphomonas sp. NRK KF1]